MATTGRAPRRVDFVRQHLQRGDGIFDEQQPVADRLQLGVPSKWSRRATAATAPCSKRLRDKAMRIDKRAVETGAGVILLRQREEEFARAGRPRVNRESDYFFVKQLGAQLTCPERPSNPPPSVCSRRLRVLCARKIICSAISSCAQPRAAVNLRRKPASRIASLGRARLFKIAFGAERPQLARLDSSDAPRPAPTQALRLHGARPAEALPAGADSLLCPAAPCSALLPLWIFITWSDER